MSDQDSTAELLRGVPLFSQMSRREMARLARRMQRVEAPAGRVLTREGNSGGSFFVVLSGAVEVRRNGRQIGALGCGEFLGEIALVDRGPRTATATVTDSAVLLVLSGADFRAMLAEHPRVAGKVMRVLAARVRALEPRGVQ